MLSAPNPQLTIDTSPQNQHTTLLYLFPVQRLKGTLYIPVEKFGDFTA